MIPIVGKSNVVVENSPYSSGKDSQKSGCQSHSCRILINTVPPIKYSITGTSIPPIGPFKPLSNNTAISFLIVLHQNVMAQPSAPSFCLSGPSPSSSLSHPSCAMASSGARQDSPVPGKQTMGSNHQFLRCGTSNTGIT